ncbi:c-type cytochrome [Dyadobacter tibetensis]|uniref:c-type cytochrome n=1 Tax=Dyadobacter tibetensis TaxID=1211851 RepID=UPI0004B33921|nr:cytochrome c [Dyadobacter tibetensis]
MIKLIATLGISAIIAMETGQVQNDDLAKSIERGKMVYSENCISCHMGTGEGVIGTFPPLAKADYLTKNHENAIRAIKFGLMGKVTVNGVEYDNMMPNPGLDDEEIADVMNYILNTWENKSEKPMITPKQVSLIKQEKG